MVRRMALALIRPLPRLSRLTAALWWRAMCLLLGLSALVSMSSSADPLLLPPLITLTWLFLFMLSAMSLKTRPAGNLRSMELYFKRTVTRFVFLQKPNAAYDSSEFYFKLL